MRSMSGGSAPRALVTRRAKNTARPMPATARATATARTTQSSRPMAAPRESRRAATASSMPSTYTPMPTTQPQGSNSRT